ncbi:hypothetical protein BRO54_0582 [Geobacillus proteiniphilus]|uniref:Mobile element protein n=1 Tax=Geobacillus proteiniphilus TaxID=860353 RepID=A0A1Q5T7M5_9BACL|nr:hypothetical protein I656_01263 [Geobacillus sp. WSUCF1]OKO96165.1 hypothetical protein BRO54_0582 [Geobacillus proteiniphilus]
MKQNETLCRCFCLGWIKKTALDKQFGGRRKGNKRWNDFCFIEMMKAVPIK